MGGPSPPAPGEVDRCCEPGLMSSSMLMVNLGYICSQEAALPSIPTLRRSPSEALAGLRWIRWEWVEESRAESHLIGLLTSGFL